MGGHYCIDFSNLRASKFKFQLLTALLDEMVASDQGENVLGECSNGGLQSSLHLHT